MNQGFNFGLFVRGKGGNHRIVLLKVAVLPQECLIIAIREKIIFIV